MVKTETQNRKMNKRAVSLMVSYVLLIVIGMALATLVYIWLEKVIDVTPTPECPENTRLMILGYTCDTDKITVDVKNNGLFNVTGYYIRGTPDASKQAVFGLKFVGGVPLEDGSYYFGITGSARDLKPDEHEESTFSYDVGGMDGGNIQKIEIQPFRIQEENLALCGNPIPQDVTCPTA